MRRRPAVEPPPRLWLAFCHHQLRLDPDRATRWWKALQAATSRRAVAVHSAVQCRAAVGLVQGSLEHFVRDLLTPQALVEGINELVEAGLLARPLARHVEAVVLGETNAAGAWRHGVRRPCRCQPARP